MDNESNNSHHRLYVFAFIFALIYAFALFIKIVKVSRENDPYYNQYNDRYKDLEYFDPEKEYKTVADLLGSYIYISENGKYTKYYVFYSLKGCYAELIRTEALDKRFEWSSYPKSPYRHGIIDDYLVNNIYNSFSESVKKESYPMILQNTLDGFQSDIYIYLLTMERIKQIAGTGLEWNENLIRNIKPGTWVLTVSSEPELNQFKGLEDDQPVFTTVHYSSVGYVQPVIAVNSYAAIEKVNNPDTDEMIWVIKGDK
ncbi:MAG: hypothetical protein J5372_02840 [Lachnospiraceae bacterium]|nr:hypothetical protein [Lachnospiraceae bacterium]